MSSRWIKKRLTEEERIQRFAYNSYECPDCFFNWTYGETKFCPNCGNYMEVNEDA